MQLYSECMYCIVEHHWSLVKDCPDEARKAAFMREVLRTVAEADPGIAPPVPTARLQRADSSCESTVAQAAPATPILKDRINRISRNILRAEENIRQ